MPQEYIGKRPERARVQEVQASRDVKGSPWGGGGFVDYGGQAAGAFQDQIAAQEQRDDYEKKVRDAETKELDADFGKLTYEPTGVGGIDGSADVMAREWKADYVKLKKDYDKGLVDPAEFSSQKQQLFGNAKTFKGASEALQQTVTDYEQAVADGTVSDSTPPEIREALDNLRKGGENMNVQNINGVPTLVGAGTISGNDISIPLSAIAGGQNVWRFNTKFDENKALEMISTGLEGKNLSPEQAALRGGAEIEKVLNNESTVRAIAADSLGIDSLTYEENSEESKAAVQQYLQDKLEAEYQPAGPSAYQNAQLDQGQQRIDIAQQNANKAKQAGATSATGLKLGEAQRVAQTNNKILNNAIKSKDFTSLIGRAGITAIDKNFFGDGFTVEVGDQDYEINPNDPSSIQQLHNLLGTGGVIGGEEGGKESVEDRIARIKAARNK